MSVEVLEHSSVSRPNQANLVYQTRCATCGGRAFALGGGSLFCWVCLMPFVIAGQVFEAENGPRHTRNVPA